MSGALLLLCALALPQDRAAEPAEEQVAFLEIRTERDTYYVQEPIRVQLHIGFDAEFFRTKAIQLFRRELDVPLQVEAPWLRDLPGAFSMAGAATEPVAGRRRASIAIGAGVSTAIQVGERVVEGRRFSVLEIERIYLAESPGELTIPAAGLNYAYATRFREDILNGRVASDRRDVSVRSQPRTVRIQALPDEGRPAWFSGAVGRFDVRAEASPRELSVGDSLKLVLHIEGRGNLPFLDAPELAVAGFHVYGKIEERTAARRTVTYDIVPLRAEPGEIPPIPFAFFDPRPPVGYRTVHTEAIPLAIRPLPAGVRLELLPGEGLPRAVPGENDLHDIRTGDAIRSARATRGIPAALLLGALLAPWPLALGLWSWLRRREREHADPEGQRARAAAGVFHAQAERPDADLAEALAGYLAARLGCLPAAVIAPELAQRLGAAGIPAELAERTARVLDELTAARYGGRSEDATAAKLAELVEALEAGFGPREAVR